MTGFAVIDLETMGLAYLRNDRICEVAVVLLDVDGNRQDAWTTLINPQRDLGAQHIHHIDATDARLAPTFAQAMGDLTELLRGRVVAAHNATFDASFLAAEYARAGAPIALTPADALCTMRMAGQSGAPAKLGDCLAHLAVQLTDAHAARTDTGATPAAHDASRTPSNSVATVGGMPPVHVRGPIAEDRFAGPWSYAPAGTCRRLRDPQALRVHATVAVERQPLGDQRVMATCAGSLVGSQWN